MKVLVACEESQTVCKAFRERGHEAFSCDIEDCSGGHPEWHIKGDCLRYINGNCSFVTSGGGYHQIEGKWDLVIAHPPCTYLTVAGNRWFDVEKYGEAAILRQVDRKSAVSFFLDITKADCDRMAIENPIGIMSSIYRKPDQVIQPYWFGHPARKKTCLWLKGLPPLLPTEIVEPEIKTYICKNGKKVSFSADYGVGFNTPHSQRRSATYEGIGRAMAEQWG